MARLPGIWDAILLQDFEWHYLNKELPRINKTYAEAGGYQQFFVDLADLTIGSFAVSIELLTPIGSELVVAHAKPTMTMDGATFQTDAVVVWCIVDGKLAEAWDIPGVRSAIQQVAD